MTCSGFMRCVLSLCNRENRIGYWCPNGAPPARLGQRAGYCTVNGVPRRSGSTLAERLNGFPGIPRVAPWAGMRRPFGAESDTTLQPGSHINRSWFNNERFVLGLAPMRVSPTFCRSESIHIDFEKKTCRSLRNRREVT